jgi:hypothetical protein
VPAGVHNYRKCKKNNKNNKNGVCLFFRQQPYRVALRVLIQRLNTGAFDTPHASRMKAAASLSKKRGLRPRASGISSASIISSARSQSLSSSKISCRFMPRNNTW